MEKTGGFAKEAAASTGEGPPGNIPDPEVLERYEPAIRLAREVGDPVAEADFAWARAIGHDALGYRHEATELAQAAVAAYQQLSTPHAAAHAECLERFGQGGEDPHIGQPDCRPIRPNGRESYDWGGLRTSPKSACAPRQIQTAFG